MPKGEHFKKDNPRIHQVSFKVNKTELEQLQKVVGEAGMSIPEWIRSQIDKPNTSAPAKVTRPKSKPKDKPTSEIDTGVHKGDQTSLF